MTYSRLSLAKIIAIWRIFIGQEMKWLLKDELTSVTHPVAIQMPSVATSVAINNTWIPTTGHWEGHVDTGDTGVLERTGDTGGTRTGDLGHWNIQFSTRWPHLSSTFQRNRGLGDTGGTRTGDLGHWNAIGYQLSYEALWFTGHVGYSCRTYTHQKSLKYTQFP